MGGAHPVGTTSSRQKVSLQMAKFNISQLFFRDDEPPDERLVQLMVEQIRKGKPVQRLVFMQRKDGGLMVVDGHARLEAARQWGVTTIEAYVIQEEDLGPE
jgi:ParB-like chromosome segregation protein Spo0J